MKTRHKIMSFLLSGAMVFSLLPASAIGTVKAASVNYALTATATASGSETSDRHLVRKRQKTEMQQQKLPAGQVKNVMQVRAIRTGWPWILVKSRL